MTVPMTFSASTSTPRTLTLRRNTASYLFVRISLNFKLCSYNNRLLQSSILIRQPIPVHPTHSICSRRHAFSLHGRLLLTSPQAESELSDKEKRLDIDSTILHARTELLKALSLPANTPDSDPRIAHLTPSFSDQIKTRTKEILIHEEVRRRKAFKMNLANEGLEAKRKEEEASEKKRKAEQDANWEGE